MTTELKQHTEMCKCFEDSELVKLIDILETAIEQFKKQGKGQEANKYHLIVLAAHNEMAERRWIAAASEKRAKTKRDLENMAEGSYVMPIRV